MATKKTTNFFEDVTGLTQNSIDNSKKLATTEFVKRLIVTGSTPSQDITVLQYVGFFDPTGNTVLVDGTGQYGFTYFVTKTAMYDFGNGVSRIIHVYEDDLLIYDNDGIWKKQDDFIGFNNGDGKYVVASSEIFLRGLQNKQDKIEPINHNELLGRKSIGAGAIEVLTKPDVKSILNYVETDIDIADIVKNKTQLNSEYETLPIPIISSVNIGTVESPIIENRINWITSSQLKSYILSQVISLTDINFVNLITSKNIVSTNLNDYIFPVISNTDKSLAYTSINLLENYITNNLNDNVSFKGIFTNYSTLLSTIGNPNDGDIALIGDNNYCVEVKYSTQYTTWLYPNSLPDTTIHALTSLPNEYTSFRIPLINPTTKEEYSITPHALIGTGAITSAPKHFIDSLDNIIVESGQSYVVIDSLTVIGTFQININGRVKIV